MDEDRRARDREMNTICSLNLFCSITDWIKAKTQTLGETDTNLELTDVYGE